MSSLVYKLTERGLISPPFFPPSNVQYETVMGSLAYGVSDVSSAEDIYGVCIPPKEILFPHLAGVIAGFDSQVQNFEQYEQHHIKFSDKKEYDIVIYNIVKYFRLCLDCNPNMIDSLFTPANCVKHVTQVGTMIRENLKLFLGKKCWPRFKGYAYSQMNKIMTKTNPKSEKRQKSIEKYGFDVKFAYHVVRLLNEVEMILTEGDLDLQRNRKQLKSIREGEWSLDELNNYFKSKERELETVYNSSSLPYSPREQEDKQLLIDCLKHHYGSLDKKIVCEDRTIRALRKVKEIVDDVLL